MHFGGHLHVKNIHFVRQIGIFEHLFGFPEQHILVFIPRTVVPQQQLPHPGIAGHHRGLSGGGVIVFLGRLEFVFAIGTLVVEGIDALDQLVERWHIAGVAAIGIASRRIGRTDKAAVGNHLAVGHRPIGTVLDIVHLADRNLIGLHHLRTDMGQQRLLADEIAAGGKAMLQRDGLHRDGTVLIDHSVAGGVDGMELHLEAQVVSKEVYLAAQDGAERLRAVDMEGGRPPHQTEGGDHANEAEAMVAMQMGDKDMTQFGKPRMTPTQLRLRALCTIEHQQLLTHFHHLGGSVMTKGGKRTSAP